MATGAVLFAACGVDSGGSAPGDSVPSTDGSQVAYDKGCSVEYPHREPLGTRVPDEVQYVDDIMVCSRSNALGAFSTITNNSPTVWFFVNPTPVTVTFLTGDEESALFRETVKDSGAFTTQFMAPSEQLSLPANLADLPDFQWHIQPSLTATWIAQAVYRDAFDKLGTAVAEKALARGSKSRKALISCATSFLSVVQKDGITGKSLESDIVAAFDGVATTGTCASAWRLAEEEGGASVPRFAVAVEDAGRAAETFTKIHNVWERVRVLCSAVKFC